MTSAASAAKAKATAAQNGEAPADSKDAKQQQPEKDKVLQKKEAALGSLKEDHESAKSKLEEGLQFMPYIVLSTTLPA